MCFWAAEKRYKGFAAPGAEVGVSDSAAHVGACVAYVTPVWDPETEAIATIFGDGFEWNVLVPVM